MNSPTLRLLTALLFALLPAHAKPVKWEKAIERFEAQAKANPHPENALLFVGSSSIRKWDLKKWFPNQDTINHGFGGSELEDSLRFAHRIIIPHNPRAVILYAGDNDIAGGKPPEVVIADYQKFVTKLTKALPETDIIFLPIKPSIARWKKWPKMNQANKAIAKLCQKSPHLHYVDTATPMFDTEGKLQKTLFAGDGLHLSTAGYKLWTQIVNDWLKEHSK